MNTTLLIDGDTLIYEAASAFEFSCQWNEWLWTLHGDLTASIAHFDAALSELENAFEPASLLIALSDSERWRTNVMPTYKSNRSKTRKPVTYQALREYCHERYNTFQRPTLEGDDVLGILATHPTLVPGRKIVVSIDKDMQTIPGLHLNYRKARETNDYLGSGMVVSEAFANYRHLYQTLTGDPTDGYPGCPGIGPVKAERLLMPFFARSEDRGEEFNLALAWQAVLGAYQKEGLGAEVALQNARVARICRHTDYDFKKKEVKLWTPPTL